MVSPRVRPVRSYVANLKTLNVPTHAPASLRGPCSCEWAVVLLPSSRVTNGARQSALAVASMPSTHSGWRVSVSTQSERFKKNQQKGCSVWHFVPPPTPTRCRVPRISCTHARTHPGARATNVAATITTVAHCFEMVAYESVFPSALSHCQPAPIFQVHGNDALLRHRCLVVAKRSRRFPVPTASSSSKTPNFPKARHAEPAQAPSLSSSRP